jgi:hypothetical protein
MEDADKRNKRLIDELKNLRRRVHDLEESQARRKECMIWKNRKPGENFQKRN